MCACAIPPFSLQHCERERERERERRENLLLAMQHALSGRCQVVDQWQSRPRFLRLLLTEPRQHHQVCCNAMPHVAEEKFCRERRERVDITPLSSSVCPFSPHRTYVEASLLLPSLFSLSLSPSDFQFCFFLSWSCPISRDQMNPDL